MKASDEANLLWPYLLPKIARVVSGGSSGGSSSGSVGIGGAPSPHDLNSVHHTGTLADAQAPQFLLASGTRNLTGDLDVDTGVTIDGVDLSAHVADPDAHHDRATAGNTGLSITGQQLSLNLATSSGLAIASGVKVDRAAAFAWTGTHSWTQDLQVNADIDFIGGDRTITGSSDLTLAPVDDLVINPGANLVLAANDIEWRSTTIGDLPTGISGWRLWDRGGNETQLTITAIKADELHVRFFIADAMRVSLGSEMWGKSRGITYTDFVVPADEATVDVWFESIAALPGFDIFEVNDWLIFRTIDLSGGGLAVEKIWFQVSAAKLSSTVTADGKTVQQWRLRRKSGGTTGSVIKATAVVPDMGVVGDGMVDLSALKSDGGPFIRTSTFDSVLSDVPQFLAHTQMGNLTGTVDYTTDIYGFAAGNNLGLAPSAGFSGLSAEATNGLRLFNTDIALYDGSDKVVAITRSDGIALTLDTTFAGHAYSSINWYLDIATPASGPNAIVAAFSLDNHESQLIGAATSDGPTIPAHVEFTASADSTHFSHVQIHASAADSHVDLLSDGIIHLLADDIQAEGSFYPTAGNDLTFDLGTASLRWRTLYVGTLSATTITGSALGGQTWTYPGSMTIDADGIGDTIVSITNTGSGAASLAVEDSITLGGTVDGVDIALHAGNANAHHNQSHVLATGTALGADHTMSGATAGDVLRALSATTAAFDVLQHSDLGGVSANQHHNQSHVLATGTALGADHTISGAAAGEVLRALSATTAAFDVLQHADLGGVTANQHHNQSHVLATGTALGGDHTISGASAGEVLRALSSTTAAFDVLQHNDLGGVTADQHHNQVHGIVSSDHTGTGATLSVVGFSATNTLGVLVPSSDVGTTPVAALLKSTGSGGLTLGVMTVRGSVDIINGGDLTVGANVLFVDNFLANVGINMAPDPQFALDVNGPIRGTELVGPHAIQLEDVALLLHFDGGEPYESNYTGEPNAIPSGRVPSTNTAVHYRPGKFYKAAVLGPTGTNLIANPSFEVNLSLWAASVTAGGDMTANVETAASWYGIQCARMDWTTATTNNCNFYYNSVVASSSGGKYSFGVWMKAAIPCSANLRILHNTLFTSYGVVTVSVTEEWQYFHLDATPPAGVPLRPIIQPTGNFGGGNSLYIDGVQFEAGDATWYIDGSLGSGYAWTGTANASTSTRTNGRLTYSLTDCVAHRWSIMAYHRFTAFPAGGNGGGFKLLLPGQRVGVEVTSSVLRANIVDNGGTSTPTLTSSIDPNHWYHIAATYSGGVLNMYLDGILVYSAAKTFAGAPYSVDVAISPAVTYSNLMIDDLCVSRQGLSANRIRAIYESDAPVFAESSVFHFRATPTGLVWADEEGLWMRDVNGEAVLGAYGGEAATKSWGSVIMEKGDVLLGRSGGSGGGWLLFNRDGGGGDPFLTLGYGNSAVMAFDPGGASLTGVLDINSAGGIYQGTGSFASPTTGLKIWNASGIGRIGGYNAGVAQWYGDTDGKMYAGAGNVVLDASGIAVAITSASAGAANSYNFNSSGVRTAYLSGQDAASVRQINMTVLSGAGKDSGMFFDVQAPSAHTAYINLQSIVNSVSSGVLRVGRLVGSEPTQVEVTKNLHVNQSSTTLAQPALQLTQSDLSEEFVAFVSTSGTGDPIQTAALGAYQGKVRISVNGSFFFVPYYL